MYAYTGDILQFVYNDGTFPEEDTMETRYSFGFCNRNITAQQNETRIQLVSTRIARNFDRFNVLVSENEGHEISYITTEELETEYINRPKSSLVEVRDED